LARREGLAELFHDSDHGLFGHTIADHHQPDKRIAQQGRDMLFMVRSYTHGDLQRCA
jgi:hypothetical protein